MEEIKKLICSHYKYGIVHTDKITLFNDTDHYGKITSSDFLRDVDVCLDYLDNGILFMNAKKIVYAFYVPEKSFCGRVFESDWEHEPHPKLIHTGKRHFWSRKRERFVYSGWNRTTEEVNITIAVNLNTYKIEIFD